MQHFPIFLALAGRHVVVSGAGDAAIAKLRLLLKTEARVLVFTEDPSDLVVHWAAEGRLELVRRRVQKGDAVGAALAYAANDNEAEDSSVAHIMANDSALVNVVDDLERSAFITPAIVDRDPVCVAIGTEGAAPVLARAIKADLEERLPSRLGFLARLGKAFRAHAERLPAGRTRRDFWRDYYFTTGPRILAEKGEAGVHDGLLRLANEFTERSARVGRVDFVGGGPGDPELLTLKARRLLDEADVVLHDRLIAPEILELVRREAMIVETGKAGFGPAISQSEINCMMVQHAQDGAQVVRLKSGDPGVFGRLDEETAALDAAGIGWSVVPGITAAAAAAAGVGRSLTRRGRNSGLRFLTGHDAEGYADHDWAALARPGEVAAFYMAKRSARFVQGRLLMHGADPATPITVVADASRQQEQRFATTLSGLPQDLADAALEGPAVLLFGIAPREPAAAEILEDVKEALL